MFSSFFSLFNFVFLYPLVTAHVFCLPERLSQALVYFTIAWCLLFKNDYRAYNPS